MSEWIVVIAAILGAVAGALMTAVWFLDHQPVEHKRRWWEE